MPIRILLLSLVSFLINFGSGMLFGNIVYIAVTVLGLSTALLGLCRSFGDAVGYVNKIITGFLSDRLKSRKWFLLVGYGLSLLLKPLFILILYPGLFVPYKITFFFIWNIVDKFASAIRDIPRDAMIADFSTSCTLQNNIVTRKMFSYVGTALGGLTGQYLFGYYSAWVVAGFALIPALGGIVITLLLDDSFTKTDNNVSLFNYQVNLYETLTKIWPIWIGVIVGFVGKLNEAYLWSQVAKQFNFVNKSGLFSTVSYLTSAIISLVLMYKPINRPRIWFMMTFGSLFLGNLFVFWKLSVWSVFIFTVLSGIFGGLIDTVVNFVIMSKINNKNIRGSVLSITQVFISISMILAPIFYNYLIPHIGLQNVLGISLIPIVISIIIFQMLL